MKKSNKKNAGDILGLSDASTGPKLPHPPSDGSVPAGIEVRGEPNRHWGDEDLNQTGGATGIDMGGGGTGTQIESDVDRRGEPNDED